MKTTARLVIAALCLLVATADILISAPPERSVSTSRQFILYGTNLGMRGLVSDLAEQTKTHLFQVLQQRDNWKTPIIINLQFPQANLPDVPVSELRFSQTGFGLKLQLDLTVTDPGHLLPIQREVLRAILLELMYRNQPGIAPGTLLVQPPPWLLEGLLALTAGQEKSALVDPILPLVKSNKIIRLQDFLQQNPAILDLSAQSIYRGYALALLQFLLDEPGGRLQLYTYINNLPRASNDQLADLKSRFPILDVADPEAVWKSCVTKFASTETQFHLLTFAETDSRLDELLHVRVPAAAGSGKDIPWQDLLRQKPSPAQAAALEILSQNLTVLTASANPVMRPIVAEYREIVQLLARNKRARLAHRLERLNSTRTKLAARMNEIDDYMNWFEATQLKSRSGAFGAYLKAAGESAEYRRHDALSVYLDAIEQQFQN